MTTQTVIVVREPPALGGGAPLPSEPSSADGFLIFSGIICQSSVSDPESPWGSSSTAERMSECRDGAPILRLGREESWVRSPACSTTFPVHYPLKPRCRISDLVSNEVNPRSISESLGSALVSGILFPMNPPGLQSGKDHRRLARSVHAYSPLSNIGEAASRCNAGEIPARKPSNRRTGRDNFPSQWPAKQHPASSSAPLYCASRTRSASGCQTCRRYQSA